MCIEASLSPCFTCEVLWVVEDPFIGYNDLQGGFEELRRSGAGSAEELGILQQHGQGCVGPLRGLEDPILPLSVPTGVHLTPTSPKLVEFCELRLYGVLRSSSFQKVKR